MIPRTSRKPPPAATPRFRWWRLPRATAMVTATPEPTNRTNEDLTHTRCATTHSAPRPNVATWRSAQRVQPRTASPRSAVRLRLSDGVGADHHHVSGQSRNTSERRNDQAPPGGTGNDLARQSIRPRDPPVLSQDGALSAKS